MTSKKMTLAFIVLVGVLALTTQTVRANESTTERKSESEIEAHRAELRAEKAKELEERKMEHEAEVAKREETREKERAQKETQLEERKQEREQEKEERTQELSEKRAERLAEFSAKLVEKIGKYYERLSLLSEKLAIKIAEVKEKGVDVTLAQAKLDEADVMLEEAYDDALAIAEKIKTSEVATKEDFAAIVAQVKELKNPFKDVLLMYKEVLSELKSAVGTNTREAKE